MRKSMISSLALLAITMLAMPAISETFSKTVTFAQQVSVDGKQVMPGNYRVMVDGNKVTIEKGHKTIVETQGRLEQRNEKFVETAVIFDANGNVREIRFGGRNDALVLGGGAPNSGQ